VRGGVVTLTAHAVVEASTLTTARTIGVRGPSPLLRLQSDERLVVLVRRGNPAAFEALVARYQARLLAFCRHMLASREDAEDVLQEVFAAAYNAMRADERPINVRPWLYRIARNRSLNHLRRTQPIGVDSMDVHVAHGGKTTAERVHEREDFRQLIGDVQELPETQRTALLLREIDALSYEQIGEAMETTVPSVKSLLVRARVSLAEAAEARLLSCDDVREELGEVAEGLRRTSPPVRRHLRTCERCAAFRKQLRTTNRALAAIFPVAPLLLLKKGLLAHLGTTASAGAGTAASTAAVGAAAAGGASAMGAGISTITTKAAAGLAAAAIVTAGAVEVDHVRQTRADREAATAAAPAPVAQAPAPAATAAAPAAPAPAPAAPAAAPAAAERAEDGEREARAERASARDEERSAEEEAAPAAGAKAPAPAEAGAVPAGETAAAPADAPGAVPAPAPPLGPTQQEGDAVTLAPQPTPAPATTGGEVAPVEPPPAPQPAAPQPAPPAPAPAPRPAPAPAPAAQQPAAPPAPAPAPQPEPPADEATPAAPGPGGLAAPAP